MFVTESLLAFTIFRDEFDIPFLLMFGFLLFVKCFHWLMADRIESVRFATKYFSCFAHKCTDGTSTLPRSETFLAYTHCQLVWSIFHGGRVYVLVFGREHVDQRCRRNGLICYGGKRFIEMIGLFLMKFQYAILIASTFNAATRYGLNVYEYHRASRRGGENAAPWESKSMWVFYIELVTGTNFAFCDNWGIKYLMLYRLPQIDDLSVILPDHPHVLRPSTQYHPRCLHHRTFLHHSFARINSIP